MKNKIIDNYQKTNRHSQKWYQEQLRIANLQSMRHEYYLKKRIIKSKMENPIQKQRRIARDAEIVKLYPQLTMEEIGKRYGIKRARVKQILDKSKVAVPDAPGKVKK